MPACYPDEFKQRAMQMFRDGTPIMQVAKQLGIAEWGCVAGSTRTTSMLAESRG